MLLFAATMAVAIYLLGRTQVSNKSKWTIIVVLGLVIFIIMRKADWAGKIDQALFAPRDIDHDCGDVKVSEDRKDYLKGVADQIYNDIYNTPITGHSCGIYTEANGLCDEELVYVAEYYKKYLTSGRSIYNDLSGWDGEYTIFCDFDSLKAHLSKIGQRS